MGEILDFLTNTVGGLWNDSGLNALFSSGGWKKLAIDNWNYSPMENSIHSPFS